MIKHLVAWNNTLWQFSQSRTLLRIMTKHQKCLEYNFQFPLFWNSYKKIMTISKIMIKHLISWNCIKWQLSQVYSQFITNKNHAFRLFKTQLLINLNKLIYNLKNNHKICYYNIFKNFKKVFVHVKISMIEPFLICENIMFLITLNFKLQHHCTWIKVIQHL